MNFIASRDCALWDFHAFLFSAWPSTSRTSNSSKSLICTLLKPTMMLPPPKYLTGDKAGIENFIENFDVR